MQRRSGLDIGAVSTAEIAVATMAQITERLREQADAEPDDKEYILEIRGGGAPKDARRDSADGHHPGKATWVLEEPLIGPAETCRLEAAGIQDVVVAQLEP